MKKILKILMIVFLTLFVFVFGFIFTLQIFEYRPNDITILEISNNPEVSSENYIDLLDELTIMTFNIGYASLSETEDFVMDGGTKGRMDSSELVQENLSGIANILTENPADIYLIQEVDVDSNRSYNLNQLDFLDEILGKSSVLAYNYRSIFAPFPFSLTQMMGKVNSGIATYSDYYSEEASRVQLPGSFPWPIRLVNLKRCILISRYPIKDNDNYLVVINVHLSAYDDGSMRKQEMEALINIMKEEYDAGNYVIVGGDFNQTFPDAVTFYPNGSFEYLYPLREQGLWEAFPLEDELFDDSGFIFAVDTSTPTCRLVDKPYDATNSSNNQYYLIDGFIISNNINLISVETLNENFKYSDHNPVVMKISF
jgi:endonuclease/exonuclease/phosphatase family metal-dependent hydrolase